MKYINIKTYVDNFIDNLDQLDKDDLIELKDELEVHLEKIDNNKNNNFIIKNLEDEFKIKILKEFYEKLTWSELEDIKKKIK